MSESTALRQRGSRAAAETVIDTARAALRRRIRKARREIARCAAGGRISAAHVHRLRVALRRLEAALLTFAPLLPSERLRRFSRRIRRLRRTAGAARDLDVLIQRLKSGPTLSPDDRDAALSQLAEMRDRAVRKLVRQAQRLERRGFNKPARKLLKRLGRRGDGAALSRRDTDTALLKPPAERALAAAADEFEDVSRLHAFRVAVKRLRYACELLSEDSDSNELAELTVRLEAIQQRCGEVCDRASAIRLLRRCLQSSGGRSKRVFEELLHAEADALGARQAEFVKAWLHGEHAAFERAVTEVVR